MLKQRMTALLLLLTIVFTCATGYAVVYADDGVDSGYQQYVEDPSLITNVSNADYDKAVTVLKALGIVNADAKAETVMTRGEFAQLILQVLDMDANLDNITVTTKFTDVAEDHPYAAAISVVNSLGLMNGVEANLFEPDSEVTYEQAIKVIVCALGYGVTIENGASSTDYISMATQLKILSNIKETYNTSATVGLVSKIIYNALEVKMLRPSKAGIISEYSTQENKTILDVNDIQIKKDIVNETSVTSLTGASTLKNDQVKIGNTMYLTGTTNAVDYLGYRVNAYAKKDTTSDQYPTLIYVEPAANKNETLVITDENFAGIAINNDMSRTISYYDEDDNLQKTTLSTSADILFQGLADPSFNGLEKDGSPLFPDKSLKDYIPRDAVITLIDNNGDGDYEVISIKEYTSLVVENVSLGTYDVMGSYCGQAKTVRIDESDSRTKVRIFKDNQVVGLDAIKKDDVISYTKGTDKKGDTYIEAYVCSNNFKGTVEAVFSKSNTEWITINGNDHKLSKPYAEKKDFKPGATGTFYVSFNDKIVGYKVSGVNGYAYVMNMKENKGLGGTVALKLLTSSGEIQDLSTESSVYLDKSDKSNQNTNKIPAVNLTKDPAVTNILNQVILFKVNTAGNITEILTKANQDQDGEAGLKLSAPLESRIYSKDVPCLYTTAGSEDSVMIDPKAIIFKVPNDPTLTDDYRFSVISSGSLTHNNEYVSEIFNVDDKMGKTTLILIQYDSGGSSIDRWAEPNMVESVSIAAADDGEVYNQLTVWAAGGKAVYKVTNNSYSGPDPNSLKKGDIIRFSTDSEGAITTMEVISYFRNITNLSCDSTDMGGEPTQTVGKVKNMEGNKVALITNSAKSGILRHFDTRGLSMVIYDVTAKQGGISMGTQADVGVNDVVYIRSSDAWVTHVMVFKNVFSNTED